MTLRGRNALVTGAARGIGRGIALALAESGANVALADLAGGPPGPAATAGASGPSYALAEAAIARMLPLGREQTPADVAQAVLSLASAPNVTGVALDVAGGMEVW